MQAPNFFQELSSEFQLKRKWKASDWGQCWEHQDGKHQVWYMNSKAWQAKRPSALDFQHWILETRAQGFKVRMLWDLPIAPRIYPWDYWLGKSQAQRVHARDLEWRRIAPAEAKVFLQHHHFLGMAKGQGHWGLFVKPKFQSKWRSIMGAQDLLGLALMGKSITRQDGSKSLELVRFGMAQGLRVVGALSQFLHHLQAQEDFDDVMTYVDLAWDDARAYLALGFHLEAYSPPLYFYWDQGQAIPCQEPQAQWQNAGNYKLRWKRNI